MVTLIYARYNTIGAEKYKTLQDAIDAMVFSFESNTARSLAVINENGEVSAVIVTDCDDLAQSKFVFDELQREGYDLSRVAQPICLEQYLPD